MEFGTKPAQNGLWSLELSMPLRLRRAAVSLLDGVHERLEALDADFEAVAGFNRSDAAGRAGKNDVAGEQGHVGRNESDQIVAIKNELAGVGILAELAVLELLDRQVVRIDLGLDVRAEGREGVE